MDGFTEIEDAVLSPLQDHRRVVVRELTPWLCVTKEHSKGGLISGLVSRQWRRKGKGKGKRKKKKEKKERKTNAHSHKI